MENETYKIELAAEPQWDVIGGGINDFNLQHAGAEHSQYLCFVVKAADGTIVGGVIGLIYWDWFHLDLMWVKEELRGHGLGRQLLEACEEEARRRGAKNVFLDTFSFQAPEFYKKYGYHVFGELPGFPAGHSRFFMTKEL